MRDVLVEIWESVRRNRLRTSLTGFAVAWGIFMIIVLLGAGNGLMNAFLFDSDSVATNYMDVYGGRTSKPYAGYSEDRYIELRDKDVALTESDIFKDNVDEVAPVISKSNMTMSSGIKHFSIYMMGVFPQYEDMHGIEMKAGRFINKLDVAESRKVVVLTDVHAKNILRGRTDYKSLIGKYVKIENLLYKVIGVRNSYKNENDTDIYTPYSTLKRIFMNSDRVDMISFTFHGLETEEDNEAFEKDYRASLNALHEAAPDDNSAFWIRNRFTQNMQLNKAVRMLRIALWIVGLFTLLSGIVGVSNIMLITVKERTHEFGIRKAVGAKPWDVMKLILSESVAITAFFGYIGMFLGMVACDILDRTVGQSSVEIFGESIQLLKNPTVGLDVAIEATLVLIIAGMVAGFFPARRAAKVRPIEALNAN